MNPHSANAAVIFVCVNTAKLAVLTFLLIAPVLLIKLVCISLLSGLSFGFFSV